MTRLSGWLSVILAEIPYWKDEFCAVIVGSFSCWNEKVELCTFSIAGISMCLYDRSQ